MEAKPWRDRVRQEEELVEQFRIQMSQAAKRRAEALIDGVTELGSVAEVARALGKSWNAVDKAIKNNGPAAGRTTTE
jgi:hypothetical protein